MIIRTMKEKDLGEVCKIEKDTFSRPWRLQDFLTSMNNNNNIYLVVEEKGRIIAFCGLWGVSGEGQINNVAVDKTYRNKHVANQMLKELISRGKEADLFSFTLEVRIGNLSAIRLYHNLGFEDSGIRKEFYENPIEDALIMWRYDSK